jgi:signal transduction histidine kinase
VSLVKNAVEALEGLSGEVVVTTDSVEIPTGSQAGYHLPPLPGKHIRLVVSDTGPGISPEIQSRVFDPFFTTRFAGRGLGLAAVLGIMRAHRGAIRMLSESGKGTTVEVLWPQGDSESGGDEGAQPHSG